MSDLIKSPFQLMDNRISKLEINNQLVSFNQECLIREISKLDYAITDIDESGDNLIGVLHLTIELKGKIDEKEAFSIILNIEGAFEGNKENLNKEQFTKMLELNGSTALYSIARGIIISVSSLCVIDGQIRLPMINMYDLYDKKHKSVEKDAQEEAHE